jgi:tryptophan synthase alpha chain
MAGSRLEKMFEDLQGNRAALIAYATGFYPDRQGSIDAIMAMIEGGADAVEIGVPFSDPVMDGPVIQEASATGLLRGATAEGVMDIVSEVRRQTERPLLLMTYYNPVFHFGEVDFVRQAAASGVDGIVIPDLPVEEMGAFKAACDDEGVSTVPFCSMTTSESRIREAASQATGFLYCISRLGTTGASSELSPELPQFLDRVRENASCPVAAGVGVSTPEQCALVGAIADGVIVGSALVSKVRDTGGDLSQLSSLVRSMSAALGQPGGVLQRRH